MSFLSLKISCFNPFPDITPSLTEVNRTTSDGDSSEQTKRCKSAVQQAFKAAEKAKKHKIEADEFETSAWTAHNSFVIPTHEARLRAWEKEIKIYTNSYKTDEANFDKESLNWTIKQFSVRIIAAKEYLDQNKAIKGLENVAEDVSIGSRGELSREYQGHPQYRNFLAINENDKIVGFLNGEIIKDEENPNEKIFFVRLLAVANKYRSHDGRPSREKVGTRLMLQAMAKTQILGIKTLSLLCVYGSDDDMDLKFYYDQKGRVEFYKNITTKFNLKRTDNIDEDAKWCFITYDLTSFDFKNSLKILNDKKAS